MKHLIILLAVLMSGCGFARLDVEPERVSITVATLFKDISIDPNSYESRSKPVRVLMPIGIVNSK